MTYRVTTARDGTVHQIRVVTRDDARALTQLIPDDRDWLFVIDETRPSLTKAALALFRSWVRWTVGRPPLGQDPYSQAGEAAEDPPERPDSTRRPA